MESIISSCMRLAVGRLQRQLQNLPACLCQRMVRRYRRIQGRGPRQDPEDQWSTWELRTSRSRVSSSAQCFEISKTGVEAPVELSDHGQLGKRLSLHVSGRVLTKESSHVKTCSQRHSYTHDQLSSSVRAEGGAPLQEIVYGATAAQWL